MMRLLPFVVAALLASGCYTPRGRFVAIDDFALPSAGDYVIAPGDLLQVRVFQQEAMGARVRVRSDGKISLMMVNDVVAAGLTPASLAALLQVKLKPFINNPVVTVSLEEQRPLAVSVLGEVVRPGLVTLDAGAGVLQALAAAGGLNDFAHRDGLFVLRKRPGAAEPTRVRFTWDELTRGEGKAARFTLMAGDVVIAE